MPHNWIYKINESNSRIHKEDVIKQALEAANLGASDAQNFLYCVWHAYNPFQIFNVKQVPTTNGIVGAANDFNLFFQLLKDLHNRSITGNNARSYIEHVSMTFDSDLWNDLLRPTLIKDLRIGATIKTFNKILKNTKYEIPVFECQLASDSKNHQKKLIGKKIIEPKLDGVRALAIIDRTFPSAVDNIQIYSRNGKLLKNFPHIEEQLARCFRMGSGTEQWFDNKFDKFVIDGEIVSENFQALMKQTQRKTNIDTSDSVYTIFDVIPYEHFNRGKWSVPQFRRSNEWLGALRDRINNECPSLHVIEGVMVDLDTAEGWSQMEEFGKSQVEMGYEGIMIKDIDAPYRCKRGTAWLKWKPSITVDLTLIDMEEGTGRNAGRLGALVCEGTDDGKLIKVNVGSGLTDEQRESFWEQRENLKGFIVEVKADAITQNQDGTYSLRFPRFERFRGFEVGEKL